MNEYKGLEKEKWVNIEVRSKSSDQMSAVLDVLTAILS